MRLPPPWARQSQYKNVFRPLLPLLCVPPPINYDVPATTPPLTSVSNIYFSTRSPTRKSCVERVVTSPGVTQGREEALSPQFQFSINQIIITTVRQTNILSQASLPTIVIMSRQQILNLTNRQTALPVLNIWENVHMKLSWSDPALTLSPTFILFSYHTSTTHIPSSSQEDSRTNVEASTNKVTEKILSIFRYLLLISGGTNYNLHKMPTTTSELTECPWPRVFCPEQQYSCGGERERQV